LAERSGVNPNTISRFEGGKDIMSSKLRRLEAVLLQAGVEFIDDAEVIGVRVVRPAKPEALQLRKRRPRNPKKSV
jgi:transcriptional regulator with XRE-family HTH domain